MKPTQLNHARVLIHSLVASTLILLPLARAAEKKPEKAPGENALADGGFEEIQDVDATTGYYQKAIKDGIKLNADENALLIQVPGKMLDQFCGAKKFIVVEGAPGKEVHSGKYALLLNGGFYLKIPPAGFLKVQPGEAYEFTCWAKGDGKVAVYFHLLDDQKNSCGEGICKPQWVKTEGDDWETVSQRIEVRNEKAAWAHVRLHAEGGDVALDDLIIRRVPESK